MSEGETGTRDPGRSRGRGGAPWPSTYALVCLKELEQTPLPKHELLLPLTVAYLLSAHIPFALPVSDDTLRLIEAAFDGILNGLSLKSEGIIYAKELSPPTRQELVAGAALVLTTDAEIWQAAVASRLPAAFISRGDGGAPAVELSGLEAVANPDLRAQVAGLAQLVNVQSGSFISQGHFVWSW